MDKDSPTRVPTVSKRQESVSPSSGDSEDSPPFVIINIKADNAELGGDVRENNKVKTNLADNNDPPATLPLPDFLADNPFISDQDINGQPSISLSPEDVMTILNIMNSQSPAREQETVFTTCPAATICVDRSR